MKKQEVQIKLIILKVYSEAFNKAVVREYERGILNKDEIQLKYSIGRHT
jgi:hypothetical protein